MPTSLTAVHFIERLREHQSAEALLDDSEDLTHKAVGGWVRQAGTVARPRLRAFLDHHAATMPRTMLRYAIEHLDADERAKYMAMKAPKTKGATDRER